MKIKVASRGHDITSRIDGSGNSPKYWIIYDSYDHSFQAVEGGPANMTTSRSATPFAPPEREAASEVSRHVESERQSATEMTVAEVISNYLDSQEGQKGEEPDNKLCHGCLSVVESDRLFINQSRGTGNHY